MSVGTDTDFADLLEKEHVSPPVNLNNYGNNINYDDQYHRKRTNTEKI